MRQNRRIKGWVSGSCIFALLVIFPFRGHAGVDLLVDFDPGIILISPDTGDFKVSDGRNAGEVEGMLSNMATLKAGVGLNAASFCLDFTGGVGYIYNSAFSANVYLADAAFRFKLKREEITLGPHIGYLKFDPEWSGGADISLSPASGFMVGIAYTIGSKKMSFAGSLDYLNASFDVESPGISLNGNSLDISGAALKFGMIFRF